MTSEAVLSKDGKYRYTLTRSWDPEAPLLAFVMLNPSTADATEDDPTIRRCIGFAKRDGYGSIAVANLFAYRATDPGELVAAKPTTDIVGPDNDLALRSVGLAAADGAIVVAWGTSVDKLGPYGLTVASRTAKALSAASRRPLMCLGTTKAGHPRHPLYLASSTPLEEW